MVKKAKTQRVIRAFVSSTFRDMREEREELVKRVFPQVRRLCESRGVTWGEVDLRWGISDEQKAEGKVLPICLAEIERSRPYFIGLLGERYGWVPIEINPTLIEQEPWLAEHLGKSVTELEILHGVLNDPEMAEHAFFYLRDPAYAESRQAECQELASEEEVTELGYEEAERRAQDRRTKLESLKARVRSSGFHVRESYANARTLSELVLADFIELIDRLYPEGSEPDPLTKEAAEHEAFARSRAGVYIGRSEYTDRLDAQSQGGGPPLVVLGESGSGKSALLANWALSYREQHPDELVLMHFIGASPASSDWQAMLRRIIGEFDRRFELGLKIPVSAEELRLAFAGALHMAAAKAKVVLVLDALNQLEDREGAQDLVWLPPEVPGNVRLIVSTLPSRTLDDLTRRSWPTLHIHPLEPAEREQLIVEYLAQYTKVLDRARANRIAAAPQTASPLFLRTLLEELRLWGEHETLDSAIDNYLRAGDWVELFTKLLERYEQDYEHDRPGLVGDAMTLILAARRGLSEAELLDLLGSDGDPLPRAVWSPLFLAAEHALVSRQGFLGFAHEYLRAAVEGRYFYGAKTPIDAHARLADYFEPREIGARLVDELPWQLVKVERWKRLFDLLGDLPFLEAAWEASQFDVRKYWARVEAVSSLRLLEAYRAILETPADYRPRLVSIIALIMRDAGHVNEALSLWEYLVDYCREIGHVRDLGDSLNEVAEILIARGELDKAMPKLRESEALCRQTGNERGLAAVLGNEALVFAGRGDFDEAMTMHQQEEAIQRRLVNIGGVATSLGNQAVLLARRWDHERAMVSLREAERIFRKIGDPLRIASCLANQALILWMQGELDGAMALHKEAEETFRQLGYAVGVAASLGNQAHLLREGGDPDGALTLLREAESLFREARKPAGVAQSLGSEANILREDRGDVIGALELRREEERIYRDIGDLWGTSQSLGEQALMLKSLGDLDGAMSLLEEQEEIARCLSDLELLSVAIGNHALILDDLGDLAGALEMHRENERISRELGRPEGIATALANQAALLGFRMGRPKEALPYAEEAYRLASEISLQALTKQIELMLDRLRDRL